MAFGCSALVKLVVGALGKRIVMVASVCLSRDTFFSVCELPSDDYMMFSHVSCQVVGFRTFVIAHFAWIFPSWKELENCCNYSIYLFQTIGSTLQTFAFTFIPNFQTLVQGKLYMFAEFCL